MDMDWGTDEPFGDQDNDQQDEDDRSSELDSIISDLGYDDIDGVLLDFSNIDTSTIQGARFNNLSDAILYLYDAGILTFFGVVYIPDEDLFGVLPDYPETV